MGFHYRSDKKSENQDSMWTSYSDLFLGLSVIFLLLYVTASLRQGTDGIRQFMENKQLQKQNLDLQQQLKVYNSLKESYLETQASDNEQKTYEMLMDKLNLLQDEANEEKEKLMAQAKDNENKEKALNQYQQIVRNIINANMLAKVRIQNRDVVITKKEDVIKEQDQEISNLEVDLKNKEGEVESSKKQISQLESSLKTNLDELKYAWKQKKISEKKYKEQMEVFKQDASARMEALRQQKQQKEAELAEMMAQQGSLKSELSGALAQVESTKGKLAQVMAQKNATQEQLAKAKGEYEAAQGQLAGVKGALSQAQGQLHAAKGQLAAAESLNSATRGQLSKAEKELAQARENLNARKKLAQNIVGKFRASGVKADVDPGTGDVLLDFGTEYFDTGDAKLKPGMKNVLEKALPAYAQSLFEDDHIAKKIENVEIVGFASPTFKGKYIDPASLSKKDRFAVNYNLDLSYKRARSIFDHLYTNMDFQQKQNLLPLVKVTGRSFLGDKNQRGPTGDGTLPFCDKNDCAKKQTVIIKFKLKD